MARASTTLLAPPALVLVLSFGACAQNATVGPDLRAKTNLPRRGDQRTWHVSTTGDDQANNGHSPGSSCLTVQSLVDRAVTVRPSCWEGLALHSSHSRGAVGSLCYNARRMGF